MGGGAPLGSNYARMCVCQEVKDVGPSLATRYEMSENIIFHSKWVHNLVHHSIWVRMYVKYCI